MNGFQQGTFSYDESFKLLCLCDHISYNWLQSVAILETETTDVLDSTETTESIINIPQNGINYITSTCTII